MSTTTAPQADTETAPQLVGETAPGGAFKRQENAFRDRITADGSSGYKAEPGRYHIYVSLACPWAHRTLIVRNLKGLEDVVSASSVDPIRDERGWAFRESADGSHGPDPVNGFRFLSEAYLATDPAFKGRYTVPAVWDRKTGRIVTNDFHTIPSQLETEFEAFADRSVDLYPEGLRPEIDAVNRMVYERVNNGVYEAGFATSQAAYERAFDTLFAALDELEGRLAGQRFLAGDKVTDADVRLFTTLVRFDAVYVGHFKCNLRRLVDYPNLWGYARDLYQRPGFGETVNFDHIKRHYYQTHDKINPSRIVPKGPAVDWLSPHDRDRLG
ncbi:MAG: Glutathione S-transferase, omega [uncultured Thermomicrobiales bacterium]|uniref:Glutathione S-transferase, omega n=1 Tax=uncultured Thermomicrobiales bacterium TaxID=1645740 RepID=A0A6J4UBW9_9BACT|nr:MAG: Glutathione S-transferase, omega [uncultured Thermomicrobiales bacterium]